MVIKRFLITLLLSGAAFSQTTLRVPSGSSNQCDNANCVSGSQSQDGTGIDDADTPDQISAQYQYSRSERGSGSGATARADDQSGRYNRGGQEIPTYRIPGERSDEYQRDGEFPRNGSEPLD